MTTAVPVADKTVDLSSLRCPNLVIGIIQALRTVPPGRVLRINETIGMGQVPVGADVRPRFHGVEQALAGIVVGFVQVVVLAQAWVACGQRGQGVQKSGINVYHVFASAIYFLQNLKNFAQSK